MLLVVYLQLIVILLLVLKRTYLYQAKHRCGVLWTTCIQYCMIEIELLYEQADYAGTGHQLANRLEQARAVGEGLVPVCDSETARGCELKGRAASQRQEARTLSESPLSNDW
jgi:hypothetical protein